MGRGIRDEPALFAGSMVGSVLFAAGLAGSGWVLGWVSDEILLPAYEAGRADTRALVSATLALFAVAVLTTLGVVVRRVLATILTFRLEARYRRATASRLLELPLTWHRRHRAGQLLSIANSDAEAAFAIFAPLPYALGTVVMIVIAAAFMLAADWVLALVGLSAIPLLFLANAAYQATMASRVAAAQQARADVSDVAHESFDGAVTIRALGAEATQAQRFAVPTAALRAANISVGRGRSIFEPVIELLPALASLAVLVVGTWRVTYSGTDVGDVVQIVYLLTILAFPVRAFGWVLAQMPRSVVGWRRLRTVLDEPGDTVVGERAAPSGQAPVRVNTRGVSVDVVDPDGSIHRLVRDVTIGAPAGRVLAVVGATGAGKSTLLAALLRLVDPAGGSVELDGSDLRTFTADALPTTVGYVAQTVFVFDDTVRGNITLGRTSTPAGTDEDELVWRALRLARLDDVVEALPAGLDTQVGERGATLSGGQRQRLGIARAIVTRPRVLVFDDATSALDATLEAELLHGLRAAWPVTVIAVAYRPSTILAADAVVHLAAGRVVDAGAHEDLLVRDPGYRDLVQAYARQAADRVTEQSARSRPVGAS